MSKMMPPAAIPASVPMEKGRCRRSCRDSEVLDTGGCVCVAVDPVTGVNGVILTA